MKKKMALLALAATAWLGTTANTPVTRSVENPFIESTNTMTLDISKVELSDTATVLYTDAYFRPHYCKNQFRILPASRRQEICLERHTGH